MRRIPLQIVEGRLVVTTVIECSSLRIQRQIMDFVIDTGSPDSYLSDKDVRRMQIPMRDTPSIGEVDFGGSRFKQIRLPKIKMYFLQGDIKKGYYELEASLLALKTTKMSEEKIQRAQVLPSILGLDFLREQKISLHVILIENLAYLQVEE